MGNLSLKRKIFNQIIFRPFENKVFRFKGPQGVTLLNFIDPDTYLNQINGTGNIVFYLNGIDQAGTTFFTDGYDWYLGFDESIQNNYVIPLNAIISLTSTSNLYALLTLGENVENYYQGKTSIKKQNLTKLKPYSIDGGGTTYDDTAVYIFKGGSTNTVSTVFNYLELQGGSSIGNSDGIFLSVSNTYVFYKSSGFGGTGWRRADTNTDATNLVINENELIYFTPRSLKEISVGSGAIIQRNNNGKLNLN